MRLEDRVVKDKDRVYDTEFGWGTVFVTGIEYIKVKFDKVNNDNVIHNGWQYSDLDNYIARLIYDGTGVQGKELKQTLFWKPPKPQHECNGLIVCEECRKDAVMF